VTQDTVDFGSHSSFNAAEQPTYLYPGHQPAEAGPNPVHVGKYEIVRPLGGGGQATAWLAFDPDLRRQVVVKLYHAARTPEEQERVLKEGQALARVHSRYVAHCNSAERHDGTPYLVMEYIPGKNLVELQAGQPLDVDRALELTAQLAEGLASVHACGLLHRDLKPSNVLVGDDGVPRLVDFGLAEPLAGEGLSRVSGTLPYMAPEQARGDGQHIDARSDIFGLGAVLYEMLTGGPPYRATDRRDLLREARDGDLEPPVERRPKMPKSVNALCLRCLAREPADRFSSAAELAGAARRCRSGWTGFDFLVRLGPFKLRLAIAVAAALLLLAPLTLWKMRPPGDAERYAVVVRHEGEPVAQPPAPAQRDDGAEAPRLKTAVQEAKHPADRRALRQDFAIAVTSADGRPFSAADTAFAKGNKLSLRIELAKDAYVGAWAVNADGSVVQLFPNDHEPDNHLKAGRPHTIPTPEPGLAADDAARGKEYIHVVASTAPWSPPHTLQRATELGTFPSYTRLVEKRELQQVLEGVVSRGDKPAAEKDAPAVSEVIIPLGGTGGAEPGKPGPP
jgi:hypothetical protein